MTFELGLLLYLPSLSLVALRMFACFLSHSLICLSTWSSQVKYESGGIKAERERKKSVSEKKEKKCKRKRKKERRKACSCDLSIESVSKQSSLSLSLSDLKV